MEKVYRKIQKGKRFVYEPIGYNDMPDMSDGIWVVQSSPSSKSYQGVWRVGDLKRPVDLVTHASLMTLEDMLCKYMMKLGDENSEEFKIAKGTWGWGCSGPIVYNISPMALVSLFLTEIGKQLEEGVNTSIDTIFFKFRESLDYSSTDYGIQVRLLYQLSEWLRQNNYTIKNKV